MITYGIKVNGKVKNIKEFGEIFIRDSYEIPEEIPEIPEPTEEEQNQAIEMHEVGNAIYASVMDVLERVCKDRDLDFEKTKDDLMDTIISNIAYKFSDLVLAKANGSLTDEINNIINNAIIQKQMNENKQEEQVQEVKSAVPLIDEIVPTPLGPSSSSYRTDLLSDSEKDAILNPGLSYADQHRTEKIVMNGPEDTEEIEAGDGVEETTVYLNEIEEGKKIRM